MSETITAVVTAAVFLFQGIHLLIDGYTLMYPSWRRLGLARLVQIFGQLVFEKVCINEPFGDFELFIRLILELHNFWFGKGINIFTKLHCKIQNFLFERNPTLIQLAS